MNRILKLIVLALCSSVALAGPTSTLGPDEPYDVSMLQLIVTPEKYQDKVVRVIGYMNLEFEGDAIYFHQEDYEQSIFSNALWLDTNREVLAKLHGRTRGYVIVQGRFTARLRGHMGAFSGEIDNVTRVDLWKNEAIDTKEPKKPSR